MSTTDNDNPSDTGTRWTWGWYWGRMKYELRWLPWWLRRVLHGESRWYAPLRGLFHALVLMYECEICAVCGHPVGAVWHAQDDLWLKVNGHYSGTTCASCFNRQACDAGASPYWEVHDGKYPTCAGSPCVHIKPMLIQAESATECWEALVAITGDRETARAAIEAVRA